MEEASHLLPESILQKSPSYSDGVTPEVEKLHRIFGVELIQEAGILLHQPQVVISTASALFHRFFYRKSLLKFDAFTLAMGCILLASKVEEKLRVIREVLYVFHHIYQKRKGLKLKPIELGGERYHQWKSELLLLERHILKELGFDLYNVMDHPHKYILYFTKVLDGTHKLSQRAWNYLNDSLRLDLGLRYTAQEIVCAAIYLASRVLLFPLPRTDPPWWMLMAPSFDRVCDIAEMILSLYTFPKVNLFNLEHYSYKQANLNITWLEPLGNIKYLSKEICQKYDEKLDTEESMQPRDPHQHSRADTKQPSDRLASERRDAADQNHQRVTSDSEEREHRRERMHEMGESHRSPPRRENHHLEDRRRDRNRSRSRKRDREHEERERDRRDLRHDEEGDRGRLSHRHYGDDDRSGRFQDRERDRDRDNNTRSRRRSRSVDNRTHARRHDRWHEEEDLDSTVHPSTRTVDHFHREELNRWDTRSRSRSR